MGVPSFIEKYLVAHWVDVKLQGYPQIPYSFLLPPEAKGVLLLYIWKHAKKEKVEKGKKILKISFFLVQVESHKHKPI